MRALVITSVLSAPWPALGRTDPMNVGEVMTRIENVRAEAPRPWSTLWVRTPPKDFGRFESGFAVEWNSAWMRPDEFVPALNEQAADGPRRSFADPRWSAVPGFRADADADIRWFWASEGPLLSAGSVRGPIALERPSPSARHIEGELCSVVADLVAEASGLPAHCVARRTTNPSITLDVAAGEALHVSLARAVAAAGDVCSIGLYPLAVEAWPRRLPKRVAIAIRAGAPRPPFTCTSHTTPTELLDASEDGRLGWLPLGDDRWGPKDCPIAEGLRATLAAIGRDRCLARSRLLQLFESRDARLAAWRPHLARVLRIRAGDRLTARASRSTLALWATPGFLTGQDGLKPKVRAALEALEQACAQALPEAYPEDTFPGDWEAVDGREEVGVCRGGSRGTDDRYHPIPGF